MNKFTVLEFKKVVQKAKEVGLDLKKLQFNTLEELQELVELTENVQYFVELDPKLVLITDLKTMKDIIYVETCNNLAHECLLSEQEKEDIEKFIERVKP